MHFDMYTDIVLIVYMFAKNFFSQSWCEKIIKRGDTQGGITNK